MSNENDAEHSQPQGSEPSAEGATAPALPPLGQGQPLAPLNQGQDAGRQAPDAHQPPTPPVPGHQPPAPSQAGGSGYPQPAPTAPGGYPPASGPAYPGAAPIVPDAAPPAPHIAPAPAYPGSYPTPGAAPQAPGGHPSASPAAYPGAYSAPSGSYTAAPGGYPATPGGYPATPGGYPAAPGAYPAAPGAYPAYAYGIPSGRRFWGLLFLFYIPYVGWIVTLIVSLMQRAGARQSPFPIVRENARWAANWALSYTLYLIVSIGLTVIIGIATATSSYEEYYGTYRSEPSGWIAVPIILLFAIGVYCLVTMIRGCVIADRVVHRPALALPFFRA